MAFLGKKGPLQKAMKAMKDMAPEERKSFGQVSNKAKQEIAKAIETMKENLEEAEEDFSKQNEVINLFFIISKDS